MLRAVLATDSKVVLPQPCASTWPDVCYWRINIIHPSIHNSQQMLTDTLISTSVCIRLSIHFF